MIIGYLRVSTEKQHPANQQDEIRRFAESKQLIVNHWVTEVASGKKSERDRKLGVLLRHTDRHGNFASEPDAHGYHGDYGQMSGKGNKSLYDQGRLLVRQHDQQQSSVFRFRTGGGDRT